MDIKPFPEKMPIFLLTFIPTSCKKLCTQVLAWPWSPPPLNADQHIKELHGWWELECFYNTSAYWKTY